MNQFTMPFIKVGTKILAVEHIIAIGKSSENKVNVHMVDTEDFITFTGDEARAVWEWASAMLRCRDLTVEQPAGKTPMFTNMNISS